MMGFLRAHEVTYLHTNNEQLNKTNPQVKRPVTGGTEQKELSSMWFIYFGVFLE